MSEETPEQAVQQMPEGWDDWYASLKQACREVEEQQRERAAVAESLARLRAGVDHPQGEQG